MEHTKRRVGIALATALLLSPLGTPVLAHAESVKALIAPHAASYGYYVDTYRNNNKQNTTDSTNPALGVLSQFGQLWSPTKGRLNNALINEGIAVTAKATQTRSTAEIARSFLTDRRVFAYSMISGLGPYARPFIQNADAQTDYQVVPAAPQPGNTPYSSLTWANPSSRLGAVVQLVNLTQQPYGSTYVPKQTIKFVRPYRQSPSTVFCNPYLVNVMHDAPANDYDFPSGHATAAFEIGGLLAAVFPERYQQILTRSTEMGYDRLLAGRHTPFAVMGSRVLGTAVAASILNDPQNAALIKQAYQETQSDALLKSPLVGGYDDFANYQQNRRDYRYRMTYDLPRIGNRHLTMRVPKGAEVLLATRLPYLTATQRRLVLYTTGLPSGYPILDDAEGWGRLDLFSAANGFGKLLVPTRVTMDAAKGGFNAHDTWRNNIAGRGSLIKAGTGTLTLAGHDGFTGGLRVTGGDLALANASAAGNGTVTLQAGTLTADVAVRFRQGYRQVRRGTLALRMTKGTAVRIHRTAQLAGTLRLIGVKDHHTVTLMTFGRRHGKFAHVYGLPKGSHLVYTAHSLRVVC